MGHVVNVLEVVVERELVVDLPPVRADWCRLHGRRVEARGKGASHGRGGSGSGAGSVT